VTQPGDARIPTTFLQAGAARFWLAVLCVGIGGGVSAILLTRLLEIVQHLVWAGSGTDMIAGIRGRHDVSDEEGSFSDAAIGAQLDRVEESLSALTGRSTRPWFRPPFGAQNARLVQAAADRGYNTVMWTADSADWRDDVSAATVERQLLTYAAPGAILIEHLGSPQSAQVLSDVLRALKERGMSLGTLSDLLADR